MVTKNTDDLSIIYGTDTSVLLYANAPVTHITGINASTVLFKYKNATDSSAAVSALFGQAACSSGTVGFVHDNETHSGAITREGKLVTSKILDISTYDVSVNDKKYIHITYKYIDETSKTVEVADVSVLSSSNVLETIDTMQKNISTLNSSVNATESAIETLNSSVNVNERAIETLNTSVNANESAIETLNSSVNANESAIETLNTSVNANESAISTLNSSVNTNESAIETLNSSVNANESAIVTLNTSVNANESAISTLNSSVNTNESAIETLKNSIETSTNIYKMVDSSIDYAFINRLTLDASTTATHGFRKTYDLIYTDASNGGSTVLGSIDLFKDLVLDRVHLCKSSFIDGSLVSELLVTNSSFASSEDELYLHFIWADRPDGTSDETYIKVSEMAPVYMGDHDVSTTNTSAFMSVNSNIVTFDTNRFINTYIGVNETYNDEGEVVTPATGIYEIIINNEEVTSTALNDLNDRINYINNNLDTNPTILNLYTDITNINTSINDVSSNVSDISTKLDDVSSNISDISTKLDDLSEIIGSEGDDENEPNGLYKIIIDNEKTTATALNELKNIVNNIGESETILNIYKDISDVNSSILDISTKLSTTNSSILDISTKLSTTNSSILDISTKIVDIYTLIGNDGTDGKSPSGLYEIIIDNEEVTASALNTLNKKFASIENGDNIVIQNISTSISDISTDLLNTIADVSNIKALVGSEGDETTEPTGLYKVILDNEKVTATALNNLKSLINNNESDIIQDISDVSSNVSDISTKVEDLEDVIGSEGDDENEPTGLYKIILDNEKVTATSLTDLDYRIKALEDKDFTDIVSDVNTKVEDLEDVIGSEGDDENEPTGLYKIILDNEKVTAEALTYINNKVGNADDPNEPTGLYKVINVLGSDIDELRNNIENNEFLFWYEL